MKKTAKEIKVGDTIEMGGEPLVVDSLEISDIGKQGTSKVRIVAKKANGESIIIIRPADYPLTVK